MIQPSIGRKVWYWPIGGEMGVNDSSQPCDATVIYVWGDTMVNLRVTDHHGHTHTRTSVTLDDSVSPVASGRATWMPYQLGQAARASA
jgi:hypothetical protein